MKRPVNTKLNRDEKGFASIVIALVLIIVLALFTIGFAQLARREQQTALDKQKATQAQYAAESGINNVYKDILQGKITDSNASSTKCMTGADGPAGTTKTLPAGSLTASQDVNTTNGVSYSCVLVTMVTDDGQTDNQSPGTGQHLNFTTVSGVDKLVIQWGSATGRTTFAPSLDPSKPAFKTSDSWNYPPVYEFSVTPTPLTGDIPSPDPEQYLQNRTFTFYLYPSTDGGNSVTYTTDPGKQGPVVPGHCANNNDSRYQCLVTLNGLAKGRSFVIHYTPFYDKANILYAPKTSDAGGDKPAGLKGEPIIDVTGKARDVLKRLRVRFFINNGGDTGGQPQPDDNAVLPNNALQAQNICKRIQAAPPTPNYDMGSEYDDLDASCNLSN